MRENRILLGKFSREQLDLLIARASRMSNAGARIDFISRQFLGIRYAESTLIGGKGIPEIFVINLEGVDCFTLIDYVEAMRLSSTFSEFEADLGKLRYRSGVIEFTTRNHFFTDWKTSNSEYVQDVTEEVGGPKTIRVFKRLNEKEDGSLYLPGLEPVEREITYIPSETLDASALKKLDTGDYIGVYSTKMGLDVSHVGIAIRQKDTLVFRHASSRKEERKVVDEDFAVYMSHVPGIVVLRPVLPPGVSQ